MFISTPYKRVLEEKRSSNSSKRKLNYRKCDTKQDICKRQKLQLTLAAKVQVSGAGVEKSISAEIWKKVERH